MKWLTIVGYLVLASVAAPMTPAAPASRAASRSSAQSANAKKKTKKKKAKKTRYVKHHHEPTQIVPDADRTTEIQSALARGGYYQGDPTGKWDEDTVAAVQKYQSANGLDSTGKLDAPTLQKLGLGSDIAGVSAPRPISNPPAPAASFTITPATPGSPAPASTSPNAGAPSAAPANAAPVAPSTSAPTN